MTTVAIVAVFIVAYFTIGALLARRAAKREWAKQFHRLERDQPGLARDREWAENHLRDSVRFTALTWLWCWPYVAPVYYISRALTPVVEHGNPFEAERINRELTAERDRLRREIDLLERQTGIKKWNQP